MTGRAGSIPTLSICWAAMAALYHYRGVPKRALPAKAFGVFDQALLDPAHGLMQGIQKSFPVPVSRHARVAPKAISAAGVTVLACGSESSTSIAHDAENDATLLFDHLEYDAGTLLSEFLRDRQAALPTPPPSGLAPGGAAAVPWRTTAHLLFRNWLAGVERKADARRPCDLLDWLLASDAATGELALPLVAMRRRAIDGAEAIVLTLEPGVPETALERFAKLLLATEGVSRVLRRDAGMSGASLVAQAMDQAA